jgi:DNA repair exonuclease SbcCD ATPase subunit
MKLSLAEKEIVSLKMQLEDTKAHAKQYRIMSETMENTVRESSEINEKTKQILESKISELENGLRNLQNEYESLSNVKNEIETRMNSEKQSLEVRIEELEKEKLEFIANLDTLQKKFDNGEKILEERTRNRDEYAAKISVLDEQLKENTNNLLELESRLNEKLNELNETKLNLDTKSAQLEQSEKNLLEMKQNAEQIGQLEKENMEKLKAENSSLIEQINLLQQELSKVGQDICILKTQEPYKNSPKRESTLFLTGTSASTNESTETPSNMLEINRYLRTQKEQLEEKCENLNLNYQISEQRLKTIENELEFTRKQAQLYESEINQLKVSRIL